MPFLKVRNVDCREGCRQSNGKGEHKTLCRWKVMRERGKGEREREKERDGIVIYWRT